MLLQHPRERYVAIGTAHMASLCLPGSELHVGVDWSSSEPLRRALSDPSRPPILLYPGEGAIDIVAHPPPGPVTLVVIDGTWSQTKKVLRENPILAALPRYAFVPPAPSEYRIRKEPDFASVATIEALVHALAALEGPTADFDALLSPFRAMIDFQLRCEEEHRAAGGRSRHTQHRGRPRRMRVPRALTDRYDDIVCVAGEANAWPYALKATDPSRADELVHFAAHRPSTRETLSVIVRPRRELAPGTVAHTGIAEELLTHGEALEELQRRWRAFVRPSDVVCSWGRYETNLFVASGGELPKAQLDLRHVARDVTKGGIGSLSEYRERLVAERSRETRFDDDVVVVGRAGRKLGALRDIIHAFHDLAGASDETTSGPRR